MCGHRDQHARRRPCWLHQRVGVDRRHVVDSVEIRLHRLCRERTKRIRTVLAFAPGIVGAPEPAHDPERALAFRRRQVPVARGEGEAIRLPHDGASDDPDRHVEIVSHAREDLPLLVVLAAEHGGAGAGKVEQFGDDRGHAVEVCRAALAFERLGELPDRYLRLELRRVHRVGRRGEHHIDVAFAAAREVAFECSRVAVQVLAGTELQRVDEDGHCDEVGALLGFLDQREVPFVQRAHRWHEADRAGAGARIVAGLPEAGWLADDSGHPLGPYDARGSRTRLKLDGEAGVSLFFTLPKLYSSLGKVPARTSSR